MSSDRSFFDHVLKRVVPRAVPSFAPAPSELSPGLWLLDRELRHFGFARMPARTTIIRLRSGALVVISPPPLIDGKATTAIDAIGEVTYVVAPNTFHYLYAAEFMARYPNAELLAASGLVARVPDLPSATEFDSSSPPAWSGELEHTIVGPMRGISEVLLYHVPTSTLILSDLAFNMLRYPRVVDRLVWRMAGIPGKFGPGRTSRDLLLNDRALATQALERALDWPFRQIVLAHGDVVAKDARSRFRDAFKVYLSKGPSA
jgi:hypothetical protein